MAVVADYAERQQRPTLLSFTTDRIPGGAAFMACMGAERGLENHLNQLLFADLDHALVQRWITQAEQHATDFELGFWEGPYPEDQLESIARLHDVMNTAPRGTLDLEDFHVTPAMIRDWERAMAASGDVRRTVYVRERATGAFAGYSEVYWHANRPDLLWQGATGVFPQYRGYGLGRWLKAAMLVRVLNEWPNVRLIRTGNADSNAPMLKINHELGFMLYSSNTIWQIDLARVRAYLARA
jgi:GNAT superfamily N-acetyltransferase